VEVDPRAIPSSLIPYSLYEPEGFAMKPNAILAIVLIAAGIAAIVYQGITYTTREKVVDIGPVHVMEDRTRSIPLPPIIGALAIVAGAALLVVGSRKG
jgi:drug/metabolite transporter (DMT)-like permease